MIENRSYNNNQQNTSNTSIKVHLQPKTPSHPTVTSPSILIIPLEF